MIAQELKIWIRKVLNLNQEITDLNEYLSDGTVLCQLFEALTGQKLIYNKKVFSIFQTSENLSIFTQNCKKIGVNDFELFDVTQNWYKLGASAF